MAAETAAARYARDYSSMQADRKAKQLNAQPDERTNRIYCDGATPQVTAVVKS